MFDNFLQFFSFQMNIDLYFYNFQKMKIVLIQLLAIIGFIKITQCTLTLTYTNTKFDYIPTYYDYGSSWTLRHVYKTGYCYSYFPYFYYYSCSNDLLVFNNGTSRKANCNSISKIITQNNSLSSNSHFLTISAAKQLNLFKIGDFSKKFSSTMTISDLTFGDSNYAFYINYTYMALRRIDLTIYTFSYVNFGYQYPLQIQSGGGFVIIYSHVYGYNNKARFLIFYQNPSFYGSIDCTKEPLIYYYYYSTHINMNFDSNYRLIVRTTKYLIQVFEISNVRLIFRLPAKTAQFAHAIICQQFLIILTANRYLYFYQLFTWQLLKTQAVNMSPYFVNNMKCFKNQHKIGMYIQKTQCFLFYCTKQAHILYYYLNYTEVNLTTIRNSGNYLSIPSINVADSSTNLAQIDNSALENTTVLNMNITAQNDTMETSGLNMTNLNNLTNVTIVNNRSNTTNNTEVSEPINTTNVTNNTNPFNPINSTNLTNLTNSTNSTNSTIGPTNQPVQVNQDNPLPEGLQKLRQITKNNIEMLNSSNSHSALYTISSIVGVLITSPATSSIGRPLVNFLSDFWFYKFHKIIYPEIVQFFTQQVDILNQLRIKPSFLAVNVIPPQQFQPQNQQYYSLEILHQRAPQTNFMLESVRDIYTINFFLVLVQYAFLFVLRYLCKMVKNKGKIFSIIYHYLLLKTAWWVLLVGFIETNICPLTFYAFVQLNVFFSFQIFDKINLVITILFLVFVVTYSFTFYPLIYKYQKSDSRLQVLDLKEFTSRSFWLQAVIKCLRGFFQALVHGCFINFHEHQLASLIILDIFIVFIVISLRKLFTHKILFGLTLLYFIVFLSFDIGLLAYTQQIRNFSYSQYEQISYNFAFLIIIFTLFFVTISKIVAAICFTFYHMIATLRPDNKIINNNLISNVTQVKKVSIDNFDFHINQRENQNEKDKIKTEFGIRIPQKLISQINKDRMNRIKLQQYFSKFQNQQIQIDNNTSIPDELMVEFNKIEKENRMRLGNSIKKMSQINCLNLNQKKRKSTSMKQKQISLKINYNINNEINIQNYNVENSNLDRKNSVKQNKMIINQLFCPQDREEMNIPQIQLYKQKVQKKEKNNTLNNFFRPKDKRQSLRSQNNVLDSDIVNGIELKQIDEKISIQNVQVKEQIWSISQKQSDNDLNIFTYE